MYIRRAFTVFFDVQSEASPVPRSVSDRTLDWRWFCEPAPEAPLPSVHPLIDWRSWARLRTPRPRP